MSKGRISQIAIISLLLLLNLELAFAAYNDGYIWDFGAMFSETNPKGSLDTEGNYVWRYCNSNGSDTLPSAATLMGTFHSWEDPPAWCASAAGTGNKIGKSYVHGRAQEGEEKPGIQIHWVSPVNGRINVTFVFKLFDNPGGFSGENYFTIFKNDSPLKSETVGLVDYRKEVSIDVKQGDIFAIRYWSTSRWGGYKDFSCQVEYREVVPIFGCIVDSGLNNLKLESANIKLTEIREEPIIYKKDTDNEGAFQFFGVLDGEYKLEITKQGYQPYSRIFSIPSNSSVPIDLGTINLTPISGYKLGALNVDYAEFSPALGDKIQIGYTTNKSCYITLEIFRVDSNESVRLLQPRFVKGIGTFYLMWDGKDEQGNFLADGNYQICLTAERDDEEKEQLIYMTKISDKSPPIYISPQNPDSDNTKYQISFIVESGSNILFEIYAKNELVYSYNLLNQDGNVVVEWDGTIQGVVASDGQYESILTINLPNGDKKCFYGTVIVDRTPPISPRAIVPVNGSEITQDKPMLKWEGDADSYIIIYGQKEDLSDGRRFTSMDSEFNIQETLSEGKWFWQVIGIDKAGNRSLSNQINSFLIRKLNIDKPDIPFIALSPNPFSPDNNGKRDELYVTYTLSQPLEVEIAVFSIKGEIIVSDKLGLKETGDHIWKWNGLDRLGRKVAPGLYLLKVNAIKTQTQEVGARIKPVMVLY